MSQCHKGRICAYQGT